MKLDRRDLIIAGIASLGGMLGARLQGGISFADQSMDKPLNWKQPRKLNLTESARIAYDGYKEKGLGCCHGAFKGLVSPVIAEMGAPYNAVPVEIMRAGKSGVADSGSLCGALLGAADARFVAGCCGQTRDSRVGCGTFDRQGGQGAYGSGGAVSAQAALCARQRFPWQIWRYPGGCCGGGICGGCQEGYCGDGELGGGS